MSDHKHASNWILALVALGVVFGDIGTSPLYALRESLNHAKPAPGKKEVKDGVGIEKAANDALKATPFDIAFDGVTARSTRVAEKEVIEGAIKDEAGLQNFFASQRAGGILPWEMLAKDSFQLASTTTVSLDGTVEVGGVKCNVLKVETKTPPPKGGVRSHGGAVVKYAFGEPNK